MKPILKEEILYDNRTETYYKKVSICVEMNQTDAKKRINDVLNTN